MKKKTGGLAGSMNLAMAHALKLGYEFVIFIQDDMQIVRPLKDLDFQFIKNYFDSIENAIQINTNFIHNLSVSSFLDDHYVNVRANSYIRREISERGKSNFCATGIFSVERFFRHFREFESGEADNSKKARSLGLTCGRSIFPFMCWLPYPISYRGKKRAFKHRFFEILGRSGFYPINKMTAQQDHDFLNRNPNILPIMENFLECPNVPRKDIWSTGGGEYDFVAYGSFTAKVFLTLQRQMKMLSRWRR